jgi:amidase
MQRLGIENRFDSFSDKHQIAIRVEPGEVFVVQTYNCLLDLEDWKREIVSEKPKILNVTGPIYVNGAEPGNVLKVDILDLKVSSEKGTIIAFPGKGGFAEKIEQMEVKVVKIDQHFVYFSEKIKIPISPMLGKIGVAPKHGEVASSLPGPHGGNMDNKQIRKGASVYLPVFVRGAHLGVGDAHAAMGDGESILSGVETEAEAILKCEVVRDLELTHPVVVNEDEVMATAEGKTLEEASKTALNNMAELMMAKLDLGFLDSAMLISIAGDLRICQIVNALVSVRVAVPRCVLPVL